RAAPVSRSRGPGADRGPRQGRRVELPDRLRGPDLHRRHTQRALHLPLPRPTRGRDFADAVPRRKLELRRRRTLRAGLTRAGKADAGPRTRDLPLGKHAVEAPRPKLPARVDSPPAPTTVRTREQTGAR